MALRLLDLRLLDLRFLDLRFLDLRLMRIRRLEPTFLVSLRLTMFIKGSAGIFTPKSPAN